MEKREELLTAGYVVSVNQAKFVQFVQNQNNVKTRLVFPTMDRNAEILSGLTRFQRSFQWILNVVIIHELAIAHSLFIDAQVSFFDNRARESRFL